MRDSALMRRPAVASEPVRCGDLLLEAPGGSILQLLGKAGATPPSDMSLPEVAGASPGLRNAGPGQWFVVTDRELTGPEIDALAARLAPSLHVVDQSSGRFRIRVSGAPSRRMLAKGVALDLHPERFPVGTATSTLVGQIGANLARTGQDSFELLVLRGFAQSLWDDLLLMSREFG